MALDNVSEKEAFRATDLMNKSQGFDPMFKWSE
jgi:hypothetical protein